MSARDPAPPADTYEPSSQTGVVNFLVKFAWIIFLASGFLLAVSTVVSLVRGDPNVIRGGDTLEVGAELLTNEVKLPDNVVLHDNPRVYVAVSNPTSKQLLLDGVTILPWLILIGFVLWFLRGLTRSANEGDPFTAENVRRLRGIGYTLAFGGPLAAFFDSWARDRLFFSLPTGTTNHLTRSGFAIPFELIVPGMGAFILAAVFAYGVRLREDVEATV